MKIYLRIAFLVALAWGLSKLVAHAPGGITAGKVRQRRCGAGKTDWRSMRTGSGDLYVANGMVGEAIQTPGMAVARVGLPITLF